jgi:hypothetical protein
VTTRPDPLEQAIQERDNAHHVADHLTGAIAHLLGREYGAFGEHTSGNNPWQNALDAAEESRGRQSESFRLATKIAGLNRSMAGALTGLAGNLEELAAGYGQLVDKIETVLGVDGPDAGPHCGDIAGGRVLAYAVFDPDLPGDAPYSGAWHYGESATVYIDPARAIQDSQQIAANHGKPTPRVYALVEVPNE